MGCKNIRGNPTHDDDLCIHRIHCFHFHSLLSLSLCMLSFFQNFCALYFLLIHWQALHCLDLTGLVLAFVMVLFKIVLVTVVLDGLDIASIENIIIQCFLEGNIPSNYFIGYQITEICQLSASSFRKMKKR